ncbi:MAG: adenosylcobinamide-GDP ribazoletransferase [Hyphomicrobiales bacterium]
MNDTPHDERSGSDTKILGFWTRIANSPRDWLICLMFFTRLPIRLNLKEQVILNLAIHMYPYAGAVVGVVGAIVIFIATIAGLPPIPAAILCATAMTFTTGALHEDGLADMADGFGGGHERQRKLEIMKDSRIGTYGVLALIFSQALRVVVLAELIAFSLTASMAGLVLAAAFSRATSMLFWYALPPARSYGLSKSSGQPDRTALIIAFCLTAFLALVLLPWSFGSVALILAAFAGLCSMFVLIWICKNQIQGQTGDTIGATQQVSELVFMTFLLMSV